MLGRRVLNLFEHVADKSSQGRGLTLEAAECDGSGGGQQIGIALGAYKVVYICIEAVEHEVIAGRHIPFAGNDVVLVGCGHVDLTLAVEVVHLDLLVIVVDVMRAVESILGIGQSGPAPVGGTPMSLDKAVGVPNAFAAPPYVVDDGTGYASFAIIVVCLGHPIAVRCLAEYRSLEARGVDVAVLARGRGVIGYFAGGIDTAIAEFVFTGRIEPFGTE